MVGAGVHDYPGVLPPPPGATVDLVHPESIAGRLILTSVLCPALTLIFYIVRLYTARFIVRKMYPDDWLIMISFLFAIAVSVLNIYETRNGIGVHIWNVTPEKFALYAEVGVPCAVSYNLSTLLTKSSVLFFYLRFAAANFPFRIATYFVLSVVVGYTLATGFSFLYLCSPIERLWHMSIPGHCVDIYAAYFASAIFNSATDVVILLLPIWLLWPLRVKLSQKIAVGLALMPGGFVCAVSFIRLASIPAGQFDTDLTWRWCINLIWCIIEMYVGIICACLPCLKPFAKHHFPRVLRIDPVRPSHERVDFSIISTSSARLRTLTTKTTADGRAESADDENATPLHSKGRSNLSSSSTGWQGSELEDGAAGIVRDVKSKSSVAVGTHATGQASEV